MLLTVIMKASDSVFEDVPAGLNWLAEQRGPDYEEVEYFIRLLREAMAYSSHLRQTVGRVAGLRYGVPVVLGPLQHSADHLPRLIHQQFAILARTPAPRNEREWKDRAVPPLGRLATRIAGLFLSGHWDRLHQCQVCQAWFLGRRDAKTCSGACREKRAEQATDFKLRRRKWQIEAVLIPRIEAQVEKLQGLENRLRRRKWENRLRNYRDELQRIGKDG
jgi:hypothetical protein